MYREEQGGQNYGIFGRKMGETDEYMGRASWKFLSGHEAVVEGAVHSIRDMGDVAFLILRRREGLFQTVYENGRVNLPLSELKEGMCLRARGTLCEEKRAPHERELHLQEIEELSRPAEPMPLAVDKWKLDTSLGGETEFQANSPSQCPGTGEIQDPGGAGKSVPGLSLQPWIYGNTHSEDRRERRGGRSQPL